MFSTEESRQEQKREQVQQIPIEELFPFKEHPFKVLDDEAMQRTVESVAQYAALPPDGHDDLQDSGKHPADCQAG